MRRLWVVPAFVLGLVVGVAALAVHRHAVWVAGWPLPWGALLGVAAPAVLGLGLRRSPGVLVGYLLGWLLVVLGSLGEGPGGDFLLLSDLLGWAFLGTSVLLIGVVLAVGLGAGRHHGEEASAR